MTGCTYTMSDEQVCDRTPEVVVRDHVNVEHPRCRLHRKSAERMAKQYGWEVRELAPTC